MTLGTVVRSDGPGHQTLLLARDANLAHGGLVRIEADPDHVAVVSRLHALDTLAGRYDAAYEQVPGLRGVFDLDVGERVRMADLVVLGTVRPDHDLPAQPAPLGAAAHVMDDAAVAAFHEGPRMAYHGRLADLEPSVRDALLHRVRATVPDAAGLVDVLLRESALRRWRSA